MTIEEANNAVYNDKQGKIKIETSDFLDNATSKAIQVKENQKKKKKGKGKKTPPSPEEIARIREERAVQRKTREEALLTQELDINCPPELQFIRRPILELHKGEPESGFTFSLMTYNCLAQALIRRKLFPDSGDALKWFRRSKVLLYEFMHYNADVISLQEVDHIQYQSFWKKEFGKLGYESQFHRKGSKNHGIAIVWKRELFTMTDKMFIDYDKEASGNIPPRTTTNNAGLILALKFSDKVLKKFPETTKSGILIGTTHLFWHPFGTYERTRQCYVVLNKVKEFLHRVNVLQNNNDGQTDHWIPFFCGDFNSQPFDTPYLSMTSKPVKYTGRAKTVIECSTSFKFSKLREGESDTEEEGGNIEKFGKDQPQTPVPSSFDATPEQSELVKNMEQLHNSLDMRAISLYATGYKMVHQENAGLDNSRGEPEISNWAHTWNGLLDYLFYIDSWDFSDKRNAETIADVEANHPIKIKGLLRMPPKSEMEKFGHGQPHTGEYASDHLCMLCNVEILL